MPGAINFADYDYYTCRFINTDGKTTTISVPPNLIVPKKILDLSDKARISRRRREGPKKRKDEVGTLEESKSKKKSVKKESSPVVSDSLTLPDATAQQAFTAPQPHILEIIEMMVNCTDNLEEYSGTLGEYPFNKLKQAKKFVVSVLKVLDSMNIPTD